MNRPTIAFPLVLASAALAALALFGAAAPSAVAQAASAAEAASVAPADASSSAAVASASAGLSASASAVPPPPPAVRGTDIPTERSKPPTPKEWKDARPVSLNAGQREEEAKRSPNSWNSRSECSAKVLREYLRVSCPNWIGVGLVAGDPKDAQVWISGKSAWDEATQTMLHPTALADVPLRRGQSTIVNFIVFDGGDYGSASLGEAATLIVSWREGEPDPYIVMAAPTVGVD